MKVMHIAKKYFSDCWRGGLDSSTVSERHHALPHDRPSSMQP